MTNSDPTTITEAEDGNTGLQISTTTNASGHPLVVITNTHDSPGGGGRDVFVRADELDEVIEMLKHHRTEFEEVDA
jgi:hypothetical protein